MSRVSPGGIVTVTASEAMGASMALGGVRSSSRPSAAKSSQKSRSDVPHRPLSHAVLDETPSRAVVAIAMVPQAEAEVSTPDDDSSTPVTWSVVRAVFRFLRAPVGQVSPFQSVEVVKPSTPMKFGRLMAAAVAQRHGEGRQRYPTGVSIGWHERVERLQLHIERHIRVGERDPSEWIGGGESAATESRHVLVRRPGAVAALVLRHGAGSLEQAADGQLPFFLCEERQVRIRRSAQGARWCRRQGHGRRVDRARRIAR